MILERGTFSLVKKELDFYKYTNMLEFAIAYE